MLLPWSHADAWRNARLDGDRHRRDRAGDLLGPVGRNRSGVNKKPDINDIWQWAIWGAIVGLAIQVARVATSLEYIAAKFY